MLFNSPEFIFVFLPAAVVLHFLLARHSVAAACLTTTITSLIFYLWWRPPFVLLPVLSILVNFALASWIVRADALTARRLMILGICANMAVLIYFKYADFLLSIVTGMPVGAPKVPLALSFTTFVQIAFLVDVWRRREVGRFDQYSMFVAFFPHLIAGPIVRWTELGPQIAEPLALPRRLEQRRARPHHLPVRPRQENADRRSARRIRRAGVRCRGARRSRHRCGGVGRRARLFGAALFRLLRLFRNGDRAWPAVQPAPADQLRGAVSRHQHRRFLAALACVAVALPARFRLCAARRQPPRPVAHRGQPRRHHDHRRAVARRRLDLHRMGRLERRAARHQSSPGGSGADRRGRPASRRSCPGSRRSLRSPSAWYSSAPPTCRRPSCS